MEKSSVLGLFLLSVTIMHRLIIAVSCFIISVWLLVFLVGCHKDNDNKPTGPGDVTAKHDPFARDNEDETDEAENWTEAVEVDFSPNIAATKMQATYGERNGRQAFRVAPRFGSKGQSAIVVFSDQPRRGYRVKLYYANRINGGTNRGFVFKLGSMGDFYVHAPYGRHPSQVTVYY